MRPVMVTVGAALLVLGAVMIVAGPFVLTTGLYKQELSYAQVNPSGVNQSTIYSIFDQAANQSDLIVLTGALLAPVGAGLMAYGLTTKKPEPRLPQPAPIAS